MKIIEQDILTVENAIIVQSCNCMGPMGGLAAAIRYKWPIVEKEYLDYINIYPFNKRFALLGEIQVIDISDSLSIVNLFGQLNVSTSERQTEYCAVAHGFSEIGNLFADDDRDIYLPYKFGCGLGGGDWNIVKHIIDYYIPSAIICKLPS